MRKPVPMLILDKARALDLMVASCERVSVPEQFTLLPVPGPASPGSDRPPAMHAPVRPARGAERRLGVFVWRWRAAAPLAPASPAYG